MFESETSRDTIILVTDNAIVTCSLVSSALRSGAFGGPFDKESPTESDYDKASFVDKGMYLTVLVC